MVSPLATLKLMLSRAWTMPERVRNSTQSPSTDSAAAVMCVRSCASPWIDHVAQSVAQEIEAEHRDHQREAGKQRDPPLAGDDIGGAVGDHDAPFRSRRPDSKSDERQTRRIENGVAHG